MGLTFNGAEPDEITYDGQPVDSVTYNGVEVWSADTFTNLKVKYIKNAFSLFGTRTNTALSPLISTDGSKIAVLEYGNTSSYGLYDIVNNTFNAVSKDISGINPSGSINYVSQNKIYNKWVNFVYRSSQNLYAIEFDGTDFTYKNILLTHQSSGNISGVLIARGEENNILKIIGKGATTGKNYLLNINVANDLTMSIDSPIELATSQDYSGTAATTLISENGSVFGHLVSTGSFTNFDPRYITKIDNSGNITDVQLSEEAITPSWGGNNINVIYKYKNQYVNIPKIDGQIQIKNTFINVPDLTIKEVTEIDYSDITFFAPALLIMVNNSAYQIQTTSNQTIIIKIDFMKAP